MNNAAKIAIGITVIFGGIDLLMLLGLYSTKITEVTVAILSLVGAGVGWLIKGWVEDQRSLKNICQAYAAVIVNQYQDILAGMSDDELKRWRDLAQAMRNKTEKPSPMRGENDPFKKLPDVRLFLHLLPQELVSYIFLWEIKGADLYRVFDTIGTKELADIGDARLARYFVWVAAYRTEYRDLGYTILLQIKQILPEIRIDLSLHEKHEAQDLAKKVPPK